jgi:hypothetical protein
MRWTDGQGTRWAGTFALAALVAGAALSACSGPGHNYGCGDAGCIHLPPQLDGGAEPFLSAPVILAHDGLHNAFTDAVAFNGQVFAVYRHSTIEGRTDNADVVVIRSADKGQSWTQAAAVALPGYDVRDPKLAVFENRLIVTFTAWDAGGVLPDRAFVRTAVSSDGQSFELQDPPSLPQPYGVSAWRPRSDGSLLLLPTWTADELMQHPQSDQVSLLRSTDEKSFPVASLPPLGPGAAEPELLVQDGGRLLLTVPQLPTQTSPEQQSFCRATYTATTSAISSWSCWGRVGPRVETPLLFEWSGTILLFGRYDVGSGHKRTGIWQVSESDHTLQLIADLDSFGDTGSPGIVQLDPQTALLTYYTTSKLDPRLSGISGEPTMIEAIELGLSADVVGMTLSLQSAPIGR